MQRRLSNLSKAGRGSAHSLSRLGAACFSSMVACLLARLPCVCLAPAKPAIAEKLEHESAALAAKRAELSAEKLAEEQRVSAQEQTASVCACSVPLSVHAAIECHVHCSTTSTLPGPEPLTLCCCCYARCPPVVVAVAVAVAV